jgi:phosphopantothenoylcysteine decarboxylase/phosphopantothenate--cysteine ligase
MYKRWIGIFPASDITVLAAAVADYKPKTRADQKIKKQAEGMTLELVKTHDIAASLGELKQSHQLIIGFALETENEEVNARKKLASKNFDAVVLNSLNEPGAGFGHDTNKITMIDHNDSRVFPLTSKTEAAKNIVDVIEEKLHA